MNCVIKPLHENFVLPKQGSICAAGYDLSMCQPGLIPPKGSEGIWVKLGFAATVPIGWVALLLPRSGRGTKEGLMLNNTVGVIDSDFTGEWRACLRALNDKPIEWKTGDCLLQVLFFKAEHPSFSLSNTLASTERGEGGFGSTS